MKPMVWSQLALFTTQVSPQPGFQFVKTLVRTTCSTLRHFSGILRSQSLVGWTCTIPKSRLKSLRKCRRTRPWCRSPGVLFAQVWLVWRARACVLAAVSRSCAVGEWMGSGLLRHCHWPGQRIADFFEQSSCCSCRTRKVPRRSRSQGLSELTLG